MLIRNFLSQDEVDLIRDEIEMQRELGSMRYESDHGKTRHSKSNYFKAFHKSITRRVSDVFGKPLVPTYEYTRIYYKGGELKKHRDRLSCQNSMTVCIHNTEDPWPFYVDYGDVEGVSCYTMMPGDAVFYLGPVFPHWREELKSGEVWQQFYHWVSLNGPYHANIDDDMVKQYNEAKASGKVSNEELEKMRRQKDPDRLRDRTISFGGEIKVMAEVNPGESKQQLTHHHNLKGVKSS